MASLQSPDSRIPDSGEPGYEESPGSPEPGYERQDRTRAGDINEYYASQTAN